MASSPSPPPSSSASRLPPHTTSAHANDTSHVAQASHDPDSVDIPLSPTDTPVTIQHMHAPSTPPSNPQHLPSKAVDIPPSASRKRRRLDGDNGWVHSPDRMPPTSTDDDELPRSVPSNSTTPPSGTTPLQPQNQSETQTSLALDNISDVQSEINLTGYSPALASALSQLRGLAKPKRTETAADKSVHVSMSQPEESNKKTQKSDHLVDLVSDTESWEPDTPKLPSATPALAKSKSADSSGLKTPDLTESDDSQNDEVTPELEKVSTVQLPHRKQSPAHLESPIIEAVIDDEDDTEYRPGITILNANDASAFSSMESSGILDDHDQEIEPREILMALLHKFPWRPGQQMYPLIGFNHLRVQLQEFDQDMFNVLTEIPSWINQFITAAAAVPVEVVLDVVNLSDQFWEVMSQSFHLIHVTTRDAIKMPSQGPFKTVALNCLQSFFDLTTFMVKVNYTQSEASTASARTANDWASPFLHRMADIFGRARLHDQRMETAADYRLIAAGISSLVPKVAASRNAPLDLLLKMTIKVIEICATRPFYFQTLGFLLQLLRELSCRMPFKSSENAKKQALRLWNFARDATGDLHGLLAKQSVQLSIDTLRVVIRYLSELVKNAVAILGELLDEVLDYLKLEISIHELFTHEYAQFAETAWNLELCRHCIIKGRMETRVLGMETLNSIAELAVGFLEKDEHNDATATASFESFADFICSSVLQKDLLTYLTSVASHPNLVSRMLSLTLLLSKRGLLDKKLLTLLWTPLHQNEDVHFSAAILDLWKRALPHLTESDLFVVADLFQDLEIDHYTDESIQAYDTLLIRLLLNLGISSNSEVVQQVWSLLTQTSQAVAANSSMNPILRTTLRNYNGPHFEKFLNVCPPEECQQIIQSIFDKSPKDVAGYAGLIRFLISTIEQNVLTHIDVVASGELLTVFAFETTMRTGSTGQPIATVEARFDGLSLLHMLFQHSVDWLSLEQIESFWNDFLLSETVPEATRDKAWQSLGAFIESHFSIPLGLFDYFIDKLYPTLSRQSLGMCCLDFVGKLSSYAVRNYEEQDSGHQEQPLRPDLALLWQFLLRTGNRILCMKTANVMIEKAVDGSTSATREASIRQCRAIVRACMQISFDIDETAEDQAGQNEAVERALATMLLLLEKVVQLTPQSPAMQKSALSRINASGRELTIRYEVHTSKDHTTRSIKVGELCTFADFHAKLSASLGLGPLKMITGGTTVLQAAQEAEGSKTLADLNLGKQGVVLCCYDRTSANLTSNVRIEIGAQEYFDALLDSLNEGNPHATLILDILKLIPPPQRVLIDFVKLSSEERDEIAQKSPLRNIFYYTTLQACIPSIEEIVLEEPGFDAKILEVFINTLGKFNVDSIPASELNSKATLLKCVADGSWSLSRLMDKHGLQLQNEKDILSYLRNVRKCIGFANSLLTLSPMDRSELCRRLFAILCSLFLHGHDSCLAFTDDTESIDMLYNLLSGRKGNPTQLVTSYIIDFLMKAGPIMSEEHHLLLTKFLWQSCIAISFEREEGLLTQAPSIMINCMKSQHSFDHLDVVDTILGYAVIAFTTNLSLRRLTPPWKYEVSLNAITNLLSCSLDRTEQTLDYETKHKIIENIFLQHLFPRFRKESGTLEDAEKNRAFFPTFDTRFDLYNTVLKLDSDLKTHTLIAELLDESTIAALTNVDAISNGLITLSKECDLSRNISEPEKIVRSGTGHVGLRNLAMTCFMNSLLQQLFMNEKLRAFVLSWDLSEDDTPDSSKPVPRELQKVFACLQYSNYRCADTTALSNAILTFDGEPLNPMVQMDVDEFYNLLFNQLEDQLAEPKLKKKLKSYFGVRILQQIKARDCEHVSETPQEGSSIQCEIMNKKTLQESMDAYVQGELMDGDNKYSCSTCGKYVSAAKRSCLQELPDTLIFHLKRFEYDISFNKRTKIPDFFEFPSEIDMAPYTLANIQSPNEAHPPQKFVLVGVLVHNGEADSGHYFSYIRRKPYHENVWLEFNDDVVRFEDLDNIKARAYGGHPIQINIESRSQKSENAYMLFYSRIEPELEVQPRTFPMPPYLETKINYLNAQLHRYCNFLNPAHARFVQFFLRSSENRMKGRHIESLQNRLAQIGSIHFSRTTIWEKNHTEGQFFFKFLYHVINNWGIPSSAIVFNQLVGEPGNLLTMIGHFDDSIAKKTPGLIKTVLARLRQGRSEDYEFDPDLDLGDDEDMPYLNVLFRSFQMPKLQNLTVWEWARFFEFTIDLAIEDKSTAEREAFILSGFIFELLQYLTRELSEDMNLDTRHLQSLFDKFRVGEGLGLVYGLVNVVLGNCFRKVRRESRETSVESMTELNTQDGAAPDISREIGVLSLTYDCPPVYNYLPWMTKAILRCPRETNDLVGLIHLAINHRLWPSVEIDVINTLSNFFHRRREAQRHCAFNLIRATFTGGISQQGAESLFGRIEDALERYPTECGGEVLATYESLLSLNGSPLVEESPDFYVTKVYASLSSRLDSLLCHTLKDTRRSALSMYQEMTKDDVHESVTIDNIQAFRKSVFDALLIRFTRYTAGKRLLDHDQFKTALSLFKRMIREIEFVTPEPNEDNDVPRMVENAAAVHDQMLRLCQTRGVFRRVEDENDDDDLEIVVERPEEESDNYFEDDNGESAYETD